MSVPQSPVDARRHGGDSRIPRPSSLTSPMTSPVPLRRAGSLRLRGEKVIPSSAPLISPRQKHFPTISESSTASPRHHRSLQSLTPRRPSISASPNPADDDDNDSIRSFGSTQSACDHAHFARNGTTFSGRRMKYVVHCSPQHETEEYLTPTQRAARQERRLKALLAQARRDLETKDECIFRLTKEVVELRLLRGDAPPESSVTETGADATDSRSRQTASQWTKTNGFGDAQSPVADSAWGSHNGGAGDGPPSGLVTPVSLSDSGHFDDALTAAATNGSSPSSALALDERRALLEHLERRLEEQARRHEERALEDRRALVEQYERKMEEMSRRHAAQTQEERRELESAYGKRLMEAARALAEEKDRAETALLKLNSAQEGIDMVPAGLEKRLADALQRLQALQRSPTKELKSSVEVECKWNETSIQRVEEALANLEERLAEERSKREEALNSVHNLSGEISDLEKRLAEEKELRSVALEEAEKLRESDLMNSVRLSDLERRLDEELRIREENEGQAEALRERIRLNDARLADLEARLTDEIKRREEAVRKVEDLSEVLSLKEVRLAELECSLSNETLTKEDLRSEIEELRETVRLRTSQIRQLEERVIGVRAEGETEGNMSRIMHLQKELAEEQLLRQELMKDAEKLRSKVATSEALLGKFERRLADKQIGNDNKIKQSNQLVKIAEIERRIFSEQRTQTEAAVQSSRLEELERRLVEEQMLREQSVREVEQLRATSLQMTDLEREFEENKLIRDEAIREATALRENLDSSKAQQEKLERGIREDRVEVQALREAAAVQSSRLVDLERKLAEEKQLREEIADESKLSRIDPLQLTELKKIVEEEKLIREEAISQGLALQERLEIIEAERAKLQINLERKRQKEATIQGMAFQERLKLSEYQRAELIRIVEEERRLREETANQGVAFQERLELSEVKQAELRRNFEEEQKLREEAVSQSIGLQRRLELSEAQQTEFRKKFEEEQRLREEAVSQTIGLQRRLELSEAQQTEFRKNFEEEQRLREEAVSQTIGLQRRLELSEAQQTEFRKSFEEEQRLRDEAIKVAEESREAISLLSTQLAELQRRFAAELTRQQEADGVRAESLKEWESRLTVLTLALEEEQRRADSCQNQLDQFRANVQNASDVSRDLESRLASATQTAEALEKDFGERLTLAERRCKELEAERDAAAARIEELSNALKEQEERHKDINLEMYRKGQEAAKFEHRDEVMLHAQAAPTAVAVPELLAQLESTERELDKLKAMYRRLIDSQAGPSNPEATLMFLKSAFYYFLTDEANSQGHLNAIQSILGFSDMERVAVESHTYFRR